MKKFVGVASALALAAGLVAAGARPALGRYGRIVGVASAASAGRGAAEQKPRKKQKLNDRWGREQVRYGDRDNGVYDIDHVLELQYRLQLGRRS